MSQPPHPPLPLTSESKTTNLLLNELYFSFFQTFEVSIKKNEKRKKYKSEN